ncbi:MAG: DUF58 domain-containing protein [Eubacterium sp.]|nr:DUF58 domain-containing protein [Eubacterium sp.]
MKQRTQRMRLRPRPFRLLGLLLWIAVTVISYRFFRSYLLLFFMCFLCIFPVLSILSGWLLATRVSGGIRVPQVEKVTPGDEIHPVIFLKNPMLMGTLDVRVRLMLRNVFYDTEDKASPMMASLPLPARGLRRGAGASESDLRLPFSVIKLGTYRFVLCEIAVQDLFGLVRFEIPVEDEADLVVLPAAQRGKLPDAETIAAGMTEVEESNRRGNDFSEVTDVREYIAGDRIRDIHWKLSARQEEWMVKIRTQMAGMELTVVLQLDSNPETTGYIVTHAYQELYSWAEGETDIRLMVYTTSTGGFDAYTISSPADVDQAFGEILGRHYWTCLPESGDSAEALDGILQNLYPYLGGYIRFGVMEDGTVGWTPVEGARG